MEHLQRQPPTSQAAWHEDNALVLVGRLPPARGVAASGCAGAPPVAGAWLVAGGGDADVALGPGGGAGGHQLAAGHPEPPAARHGDPAVQDLVAGPLDLVEDAPVEVEG